MVGHAADTIDTVLSAMSVACWLILIVLLSQLRKQRRS